MASLKELERDLDRALEAGDPEQVASVRRTIAGGFPGSPAAAEASYKLGLDQLFRAQNPDEAAKLLREATKAKAPPWSLAARVSLGILLLHQGKPQQALFELRRAAGVKPPSIESAQAAGFVVIALREIGNGKEAERARATQLEMLRALVKRDDDETRALAHFMLGMEHKFDGERAPAKQHLEAALALEALPADARATADQAMQDL